MEYGLIVMLIASAIIGGMTATGTGVGNMFDNVSNSVKNAGTGSG